MSWALDRSAVRFIAGMVVRHKSAIDRLRLLERLLFGNVLLEDLRQVSRWRVVPGFDGESVQEGSVFVPNSTPDSRPHRSIGRIAQQPLQGRQVRRPAAGIEHAGAKLKETVFIAPEDTGHVTVEHKVTLRPRGFRPRKFEPIDHSVWDRRAETEDRHFE